MKERYQPGDEAVEVGEQTTKHRRKNAKLYLKMLVSFAFGGTVFRCTTSFGAGTALLTWCEHEARQRLRRHFFAQSPHLRSDPAVMAQLA